MQLQTMKFTFKSTKIKNDKGEVIGKGEQRPAVELQIPVPTWDEICAFPAESKERELVQEAVSNTIYEQARSQINEAIVTGEQAGQKVVVNQDTLKLEELTWNFIANMPPARRGAAKIDEEQWAAFKDDYISVMGQVSEYTEKQLSAQAEVFVDRFNSKGVKNNKKIVATMLQLLNKWFAATPNAEEHFAVYKALNNRAENILNENVEKKVEELFGALAEV